jgi:hypothetical protein
MADRLDYYFRQKVTEAELDLGFQLLERADRNLAADIGVYGIISGAAPTSHSPVPDLTIDLTAPGRAYDNLGQRIFFGTGQTVDCAVDFAGIPTEVPSAGQERWLGIFLKFDRLLSDPRTDGNSQQVFFRRDESYRIVVRQAPPGPIGSAAKVALQPDELLICDVLRRNGQTQIIGSDLDTSRRQAFIFAQGDAVQIVSGTWTTLEPAVDTVQSALDEVDAELTDHFTGAARRHAASAIDIPAHGFIAATNVQGAVHELVDDLSSTASGTPGAQKVGANAAPGTPHALPAGNVDGQLSQLLAWLNDHVGAVAGAHNASAIAAIAHSYISGTSVQAQLQEIVTDLGSQAAGTAGAIRVGADPVSGSPNALVAGTVDSQLAALLGFINSHITQTPGAHAASAISVADSGNNLNAVNVETALSEILDAFEGDHFRGNEANAGQHRTIRQPNLGGTKAFLWDALGVGAVSGHLRVYADTASIWFTINASWNGSAWVRDSASFFSGGFRFSRSEFEFLHDETFDPTFTTWSRTWRLPMSSTVNSAFELTGTVREQGKLGLQFTNTDNATRTASGGGTVTFRNRFPAAPSSITLAFTDRATSFSGNPSTYQTDRDGFAFFSYQSLSQFTTTYWYGTYTAIA